MGRRPTVRDAEVCRLCHAPGQPRDRRSPWPVPCPQRESPEGLYRGGVRAECGPLCNRFQALPRRARPIRRSVSLLLFVSAIKLVVEIALMALAGQFVLGLLACLAALWLFRPLFAA